MPRRSTYKFRDGIPATDGTVRGYMPRNGGPPLLFATDIRMTILVHLALAAGLVRPKDLWEHIGKPAKTALYPLIRHGLVARWYRTKRQGTLYVALDRNHPAYEPLRVLLRTIGQQYCFEAIRSSKRTVHWLTAPPARRYDARYTFHDPLRTLILLLVYVLGNPYPAQITRFIPGTTEKWVRNRLYMFARFGVLAMDREPRNKGATVRFSLSDTPLGRAVGDVLAALDKTMPQWRVAAGHTKKAPKRPPRRNRRALLKKW